MKNREEASSGRSIIAVVIPCFNEERELGSTCRSLGFGSAIDNGALLIIVDNASTDHTVDVAREIERSSRANSVFLVEEPVRGFVPARARGVQKAIEIARKRGICDDRVFIVQADADTRYDDRYVESMAAGALSHGRGLLFEGISDWPVDFAREQEEFVTYLRTTDTGADLGEWQQFDVVVDDKCCGYWLADYLAWGGHRREHTRIGEEIHAETTRLFMRAIARGARRHQVTGAVARHSIRRWIQRPLREFASAGFPREASWYQRWESVEQLVDGLPTSFCEPLPAPWDAALAERKRHSGAFFEVLPRLVARALGHPHVNEWGDLGSGLAVRTRDELADSPGLFIEDVFSLIDGTESKLVNTKP